MLIPGIPLPEKSQKECGLRRYESGSVHIYCKVVTSFELW